MRTTVTLDPDVDRLLRESMQRGRKTFKQALNEAVRTGLKGRAKPDEPPFEIAAKPLGLREGIDPARLQEIDDELEIDEFLRKTQALKERSG